MTKFTIEDLRDIAYRGSYDDLERELALQLLASMEQTPVYLRPFGDDGETFVACDGDDERAITLYAAPQLPQPAPEYKAAVATLESKGYTWGGGQFWKPPIGKAPAYITGERSTVPETLPCPVMLEPGLRFGKGVRTQIMLDALQRRAEYSAELEAMTPEQRADHEAGMKGFAAMLHGDRRDLTHPVDPQIAAYEKIMEQAVPDGWVTVPVEPTEGMVIAGFEAELREEFRDPEAWEAFEAVSGCEQAAHRAKWCWAAMIAAAPQQGTK